MQPLNEAPVNETPDITESDNSESATGTTVGGACLLRVQIGPVQDFIAQARSTRDLWSGSYLLSWLVAAGIKTLPLGSELIFPCPDDQPLLEHAQDLNSPGILVPNLPNVFIAKVEGSAAAKLMIDAIQAEWRAIATAVWDSRHKIGLQDSAQNRFEAQASRHLSIAWHVTAIGSEGYAKAYQDNGRYLDAVRQTRDFKAWESFSGPAEKDSLSGREEALIAGDDIKGEWKFLFKHPDHVGAVTIIKRVWHLAYLKKEHRLKTAPEEHAIRSVPAIAARQVSREDNDVPEEKTAGEKYIAAIAFDGDAIGKWVNGDFLPDKRALRQHHTDFSKALSAFALSRVREIVEPPGKLLGQLIYAGGDDVVCLVPADAALDVAAELRQAFCEATQSTPSTAGKPDASAGIAIGHIHSPLQDLIREAKKAEKRAKTVVGRPAFSVTLMKRSGEISHWGSRWNSGGLALYQAIAGRMKPGGLSVKFPHRVCQLLAPYLTRQTGLSRQQDAITDRETAKNLIAREFANAAERQGNKQLASELAPLLREYLDNLPVDFQIRLTSVIDLCTTIAFARRTSADPPR